MTPSTPESPSARKITPAKEEIPQFLSTAEAAKILGLSTSLVQSLVDSNELKGWKTRGGHRRISLQSILLYQKQVSHFPTKPTPEMHTPRVVVVQEDLTALAHLQQQAAQWNLAVNTAFFGSLTEAVLDMSRQPADMLVADLQMPRSLQESTLQALQNFNPHGTKPPSVVVLTEEKNLDIRRDPRQSQPMQMVSGPMTEVWLQAYLTGVVAAHGAT
jgi:excisionase family DNA binding protein